VIKFYQSPHLGIYGRSSNVLCGWLPLCKA